MTLPSRRRIFHLTAFFFFLEFGFAQTQWTLSRRLHGNGNLESLVTAGNSLIAVGSGGIITSTDGVYWTDRTVNGVTLHAVAWTGSRLVAVGDSGTILTSPDGVSWTRRSSGTILSLRAAVWTGMRVVVAGDSGVAISADAYGENWMPRQRFTGFGTVQSLAWTGDRLMVAGDSGVYTCSPIDGQCTYRSNGYSVSWIGSLAVAIGSRTGQIGTICRNGLCLPIDGPIGTISVSSDSGNTWNERASGVNLRFPHAIAGNGNQLVVVGDTGAIWTSQDDGQIWEKQTTERYNNLRAVVWTGREFIVTGTHGIILASLDGRIWNTRFPASGRNSSTLSMNLYSVAWAGNQIVAVGDNGALIRSAADGLAWTGITVRNQNSGYPYLRCVAPGVNGHWIADGYMQSISLDSGETWTNDVPLSNYRLRSIVWADSNWMGVGEAIDGFFLTTPADGGVWSEHFGVRDWSPMSIAWSGSKYVVAGRSGSISGIYSSENGFDWEFVGTPFSRMNSVIWASSTQAGSGRFVAAGDSGMVLVSPDALTWTAFHSGTTSHLNSVAWSNPATGGGSGSFVAVGTGGAILSSSDAETWIPRNSGITLPLHSVIWAGVSPGSSQGRFIAVGDSGSVLVSPGEAAGITRQGNLRQDLRVRGGRTGVFFTLPPSLHGERIQVTAYVAGTGRKTAEIRIADFGTGREILLPLLPGASGYFILELISETRRFVKPFVLLR